MNGATLFARFAYPPNALGYCGPDDHDALLGYASSGVVDGGLRQQATRFDGAWPYLELIAGSNRLDDPLDRRVVEAYWMGNELADAVAPGDLWRSAEERFRPRIGPRWSEAADVMSSTARPTHAFHVLAIYPFVGLLRSGGSAAPALAVLDRCRIRWGRVTERCGSEVVVVSRPLLWDGQLLYLGTERPEVARWCEGGGALIDQPRPGEWVALHWDWVCARLTADQLARLRSHTRLELERTNRTALDIDAAATARGVD